MPTGIDFSFSRVPPDVARTAGHSFAASYLTDLDTAHRVKAWTAAEVAAYRAAGLGVVAVWQGGGSDRTTAWRGGYDRGRRDARLAAQQSGVLGRPEGAGGRPVYFAVDYDVGPADLAAVAAYFSGVASVFDRRNIGIYGGRRVIEWAMSSGAASWWWQTGAWSSGYRVPGIHLYQRVPSTRLGSYDIDIDDAMRPDYGAWFEGGSPVTWCPFAERMELQPESDSQVAIRPTQFILHSIAAPWTPKRIYEYWRDSTNLESHFGLGFDGSLAQFIGTQTRADASAQANSRAISLESASNLQHTDPWTDAQVAMIIRLGVWLCQTHGIPARRPPTWDAPGIGYHRLFREWSTDGTACPGDARVRQFDEVILPGIQRALAGAPVPSNSSGGFMATPIEVWSYANPNDGPDAYQRLKDASENTPLAVWSYKNEDAGEDGPDAYAHLRETRRLVGELSEAMAALTAKVDKLAVPAKEAGK
ncbi:glycoside hydrolase domain-containing protein [Embleya sp. NPDC056575]|uniref:glycoside hydrolase domain-containing protein n=1 Tax=unclassified Embleya TaxID=2699296 RepID=UPI003692898D